jgi:glycosyltransferase 2 family protein
MKGAHQPASGFRGWPLTLLRWIFAIAVLAALIHFFPLATLRSAIVKIPPARFLIVLFLYLCAHAIGVLKWRMVVNAAGAALDLPTSAQCYFGGLFGTLFLPSIVGGDVVRLAVGLRKSPHPAAVLTGNLADRFLDVAAQAVLVAAGILLLPESAPEELEATALGVLSAAVGIAAILIVFLVVLRKKLLAGRSFRFRRRLARVWHALRSLRGSPRVLISGWIIGILIQLTFLMLTALLAISCGLSPEIVPLRVWLFAWPLAKLAAVLPLTQGGMGVREAALVALLAPFGAPGALVLAAGLVWEGVVIAGGLVSGGIVLLLRNASPPPNRGNSQGTNPQGSNP